MIETRLKMQMYSQKPWALISSGDRTILCNCTSHCVTGGKYLNCLLTAVWSWELHAWGHVLVHNCGGVHNRFVSQQRGFKILFSVAIGKKSKLFKSVSPGFVNACALQGKVWLAFCFACGGRPSLYQKLLRDQRACETWTLHASVMW